MESPLLYLSQSLQATFGYSWKCSLFWLLTQTTMLLLASFLCLFFSVSEQRLHIGLSHFLSKFSSSSCDSSPLGWSPCWLKSNNIAFFFLLFIFFHWEAAKIFCFSALRVSNTNKIVIKLKNGSLLLKNESRFIVIVFNIKW